MNTESPENASIQILVVDDSELLRTLVEDILLKAGFQVFTAADGLEAWRLLQKESIDLIVADVNMPHLSGLELTKRIRTNSHLVRLPIILMSATDVGRDRERGLIYGANAFVIKERHDLESLTATIIELLQAGKSGSSG